MSIGLLLAAFCWKTKLHEEVRIWIRFCPGNWQHPGLAFLMCAGGSEVYKIQLRAFDNYAGLVNSSSNRLGSPFSLWTGRSCSNSNWEWLGPVFNCCSPAGSISDQCCVVIITVFLFLHKSCDAVLILSTSEVMTTFFSLFQTTPSKKKRKEKKCSLC